MSGGFCRAYITKELLRNLIVPEEFFCYVRPVKFHRTDEPAKRSLIIAGTI